MTDVWTELRQLLGRGASATLDRLPEHYARSQARWPGVQLSWPRFLATLRERVLREHLTAAQLSKLYFEDLYLVCACVDDDAVALATLERTYLPHLKAALARLRLTPAMAQDALQATRERLYLPDRRRGRLDSYAGRAPLGAWLKTMATRVAINQLDAASRSYPVSPSDVAELLALPSSDDAPEVVLMKRRYRAEFREALREALPLLPSELQELFRAYHLEGRSLEELSERFGLHPSNISRRLTQARKQLSEATRRQLMQRLRLTASETDSLLRLIRSGWESPWQFANCA